MTSFLLRRVLQAIPVIFGISVVAFFLMRLVPGDPIRTMLGARASDSAVAILRARYGLDQPIPVQYVEFLQDAFRLDWVTQSRFTVLFRNSSERGLGPRSR